MADETKIQGIESGRAKFAWECVNQLIQQWNDENSKKKLKEYRSYTQKIPMYIKTNGLGATLAFMLSKKDKEAYQKLGQQITEWLKQAPTKIIDLKDVEDDNFESLVNIVISLNSPGYRALTIEVLAFLNWLKRFADGLIDDGEGNDK
jgi:CRISPR-associated protein Cmr5